MNKIFSLLLVFVLVVVIVFSYAQMASALLIVGEPIEGNSWRQRFRAKGIGKFDTINVQMLTDSAFKQQGIENFDSSYWNMSSYSEKSVYAEGADLEDLKWDVVFHGELSKPLKFLFRAWHGGKLGKLKEEVIASWDERYGWKCSVPDADIMWLLGSALIALGLIGRKKHRAVRS